MLGALALVLLLMGYARVEGGHVRGLKTALDMTVQTLPPVIFAFILARMEQALLPKNLLST